MDNCATSVIIPHLNGDITILKRILAVVKRYLSSLNKPYEIIISDGGSNLKVLDKLRSISVDDPNIKEILDYPLIFPNKNIGILNAVNLSKYEDVLILDCDNESLSYKDLRRLKKRLTNYLMVVPNLDRKGGRSNRLLGTPFLRLFFPKIYRKVPYPFPGIMGIKRKILLKIVYDNDYCFDWGGEIDLIVKGYFYSRGRVSSIKINKVDRKRNLSSMMKDAYQIYRNNIYLSIVYKKFPKNISDINKLIRLSLLNHQPELALLNKFIKENNLIELKNITLNCELFKNKNPLETYKNIETLYKKYNIYELYLINALVIAPLLDILFNIKVKVPILDKPANKVKGLNLRGVSFLADIVLVNLLKIFVHNKHLVPFYKLNDMLIKTTRGSSEFNNIHLKEINLPLICGLNLKILNKNELANIREIIKNKDSVIRNKSLENSYLSHLIGKVDNQEIYFEDIEMSSENIKIDYDFFIKLSILTTIAGYLKKNDILLNEEIFQQRRLESFLSYVLNNKKFAPIDFNLNIKFANKKISGAKEVKHNYDCVILFSGGFDSTAAFLKARDDGLKPLLLWVGFGQKNEIAEYKKVKIISKKIAYPISIIRLNLKKYIDEGWKEWNYIIPARNFIFLSFAAKFLSKSRKDKVEIHLSAHEEEIKRENTDKSKQFFSGCSNIFSEFYNKRFVVRTPFDKYSKAEIAAYWRKSWLTKYSISPYNTITCYYGTNCGRCKACLKRNIALLSGGFKMDPDLKENPFKDKDKLVSEDLFIRFKDFPLKRKLELLIALDAARTDLPIDLRNRLLLLKSKYLKRMNSYKNWLEKIKI